MTSPPFYMPTRFDSAAPRFDEHDATTLLPFFDDLEILFARASVSDDQEKKLHTRRYAPDRSYDLFAAIQQFASPATFSEFREAILDLWPGSRKCDRFRRADLEELLATRRSATFATEDELAEFYRNYLAISEQLIASQRLCVLEQCRAFATAFDAPLWSAIAHRLDILDCNRDPELAPAICDIYEAARHILRSRKARAIVSAALPAICIPVPAKSVPGPANASPSSIVIAPVTVPDVAPPRLVTALAPRRPAVALQPPSLLARPAQVLPASLAPPAPSHVAARPAFATQKPALAPIATTAPRVASHAPSLKPAPALAIPSRFVSQPAAVVYKPPAPAPAPRPRSIEESAKILAAFTWQPPRRVAAASEPAQDSETFVDVFAFLGDPFDASAPAADRVARAQRVYRAYPSLPISFTEFLHGTTPACRPEPVATAPLLHCFSSTLSASSIESPLTSSPYLPFVYLPPSSPLFASLPKPRPRPRMPPSNLPSAAPAPSLRIAPSPALPTIPSSPSFPTLHPIPISLSELLGVAPGVRELLRSSLDALEPAPCESRALSRPRDAFDAGGVALAMRNISSTLSQPRCAREATRHVAAFALRVAHSRYEPAPAFAIADPVSRPRQSPSLRWCALSARPMPAHAPAPLAFSAPLLSPPSPAPSPASCPSPLEPALHHVADDLAPSCDAPATLPAASRTTRTSPKQRATATTPEPQSRKRRVESSSAHRDSEHRARPLDFATTPAHLEAQLRSDSAPRHRVAGTTPRAASSSLLANRVVTRKPGIDSTVPRAASKTPPADSDASGIVERCIVCDDDPEPAQRPPNLRDRDKHLSDPPPATSNPRDRCDSAAPACHVGPAPRNASPVRPPLVVAIATLLLISALARSLRSLLAVRTVVPVLVALGTVEIALASPPFAAPAPIRVLAIAPILAAAERPITIVSRSLVVPAALALALHIAFHILAHRQRTSSHLGDSLGVPLGDLATCSTATSRLRLRYLGDFGSALVAASRQGPRVRSRSRKMSLPLAHAPTSRHRSRYRLRCVIAHAPALRSDV